MPNPKPAADDDFDPQPENEPAGDEQSKRSAKPDRLEERDPFDLEAQRRDPQEGLVKAKKLLLEIPVVARPADSEWFWTHPTLEFPGRAIDAGRKDYYLVAPALHAALDRFLKPIIIHLIMVRPDELKLWVRRVKGPEDNDNNWWASSQLCAEESKKRWLQMQAGGDHYIPYSPEGKFSDPVWDPALTMGTVLKMGFRNRMIDSLEHPVAMRLLGK